MTRGQCSYSTTRWRPASVTSKDRVVFVLNPSSVLATASVPASARGGKRRLSARDQKTQGNLQLAQECSDKAKWYNILAAGWNLLIPLLALVLLVLLLVHLGTSKGSFDFLGEDGFRNFLNLFSWEN
ncbi:interferon-induced transmembrane protein 5 isoform X2 [Synchiropus splendidus]|uniref:interferon-induced transmembrane protein 5 isoform X2 n=1 Tax=Synchiropus splendidus TaxID=270530 RepID=UPI00237E3290|nr:interferon-induced transmembrane protein 5 isoform X2 [Synchiropus splendidus]